MTINEDISSDIYYRLIHYAIKRSDAFLLVSLNQPTPIFTAKQYVDKIRTTYPDIPIDQSTYGRLLEKEKNSIEERRIYVNHCLPFLKLLKPKLIKQRTNPIWPSTEIFTDTENFCISIYRADLDMEDYLLQPNSYLSWRYPNYPEDLSFFTENRCWLYASSHERYIEIFPRDVHEYNLLKEMGVPILEDFKKCSIDTLFFEEY